VKAPRRQVIEEVADLVDRHLQASVTRVAVDGVDGAGKTTFADELAAVLRDRGHTVIRASVDGFHNPKEIRYQRGRHSPVGYYLDSFDYDRLRRDLLDPLSPGGSGRYLPAVHDVASEQYLDIEPRLAADGSVLVFDGIFAHRPELAGYWDCSVFLQVDRPVAIERMRRRDGAVDASLVDSRYGEGQRLYLDACRPSELATIAIDNNVLDEPQLLE
jgi:uridine kinase